MSWISTAIIAGSNLLGGLMGADAATSAASTQAASADRATQAQQAMFSQTQANVAPWLQAGKGSLQQLIQGTQPGGDLMPSPYVPFSTADMEKDPGYQFSLQQGINALENQMSRTGGANSNNLKGLIGFAQGEAGNYYQQALQDYIQQFQLQNAQKQQEFANLQTISQGGLGAALGQGQISANVGQSVGSNIIGGGNALAAGRVGAANALTGAGSQAYNQWLQSQFLNMMRPQTNPSPVPWMTGANAVDYGMGAGFGFGE